MEADTGLGSENQPSDACPSHAWQWVDKSSSWPGSVAKDKCRKLGAKPTVSRTCFEGVLRERETVPASSRVRKNGTREDTERKQESKRAVTEIRKESERCGDTVARK